MTPYGKMSQTAIGALSCLAEHSGSKTPTYLGSTEIARLRNLPAPAVRKVMTTLSQAALVASVPGPGGGFVLAKPPREITLLAVVSLFERVDQSLNCPFGPNWCGNGPQCPLHEDIAALREQADQFLRKHTLADFLPRGSRVRNPQPAGESPASRKTRH